jgi:hypothetical protein
MSLLETLELLDQAEAHLRKAQLAVKADPIDSRGMSIELLREEVEATRQILVKDNKNRERRRREAS